MVVPRKMIGLGTSLAVKISTASTTTYTTVAGLISLPGPNGSADDVDTSTIDNSTSTTTFWKSYQRGQVDPGEMTLTLSYGSTETSNKKLGTFYRTGAMLSWKVTFPTTLVPAETFTGYIKAMGRELEKDSMIRRTVTVKASGNPGFATT